MERNRVMLLKSVVQSSFGQMNLQVDAGALAQLCTTAGVPYVYPFCALPAFPRICGSPGLWCWSLISTSHASILRNSTSHASTSTAPRYPCVRPTPEHCHGRSTPLEQSIFGAPAASVAVPIELRTIGSGADWQQLALSLAGAKVRVVSFCCSVSWGGLWLFGAVLCPHIARLTFP